jgi:hypothetical protein
MSRGTDHHELTRSIAPIAGSSDRSFGLVFASFFALLALHSWWRSGHAWPLYAVISVTFLATGLLWPHVLRGPNRMWIKIGAFLGAVVSPIVMAVLFFFVVTPVGFLMRLSGKDNLRLRALPKGDSYWIVRKPPGPSGNSMRDQF